MSRWMWVPGATAGIIIATLMTAVLTIPRDAARPALLAGAIGVACNVASGACFQSDSAIPGSIFLLLGVASLINVTMILHKATSNR